MLQAPLAVPRVCASFVGVVVIIFRSVIVTSVLEQGETTSPSQVHVKRCVGATCSGTDAFGAKGTRRGAGAGGRRPTSIGPTAQPR